MASAFIKMDRNLSHDGHVLNISGGRTETHTALWWAYFMYALSEVLLSLYKFSIFCSLKAITSKRSIQNLSHISQEIQTAQIN
jgi:hypothetical protein